MTKPSKTQIRRAILANRGGHKNTSDGGIMTLWNSLDEQTRKQYLDSLNDASSQAGEKSAKV